MGAPRRSVAERLLEREAARIRQDRLMTPALRGASAESPLKLEAHQLRAAKDAELLKPMRVRFLEAGPDRTIDQFTKYPREAKIEGFSAQQTVLELRRTLAQQELVNLEDVNLFGSNTALADHLTIAQLYVDWAGFGLEDWPPKLVCKAKPVGFELQVDVPACRDTSVWDNGRLASYFDRRLVFDVLPETTGLELKAMLAKKLGIPSERQRLTAQLRASMREAARYVVLDEDNKTMADYGVDKHGVCVQFAKATFDAGGGFVFDNAFWDPSGYHAAPADCWMPEDSLANRARPDAQKNDPAQPLTIASDRAKAKEAKEAKEAAH